MHTYKRTGRVTPRHTHIKPVSHALGGSQAGRHTDRYMHTMPHMYTGIHAGGRTNIQPHIQRKPSIHTYMVAYIHIHNKHTHT